MKDLHCKLQLEDAEELNAAAIDAGELVAKQGGNGIEATQVAILGQIRDLLVDLVNEQRTMRSYGHGLPWPEHCAAHAAEHVDAEEGS